VFAAIFQGGRPADVVFVQQQAIDRQGVRLAGDIRLDARDDLIAALGLGGMPTDDTALCLHAYLRWGDDFLARLSGDFAFVLWDESRHRLVAARDQLGIRSLFYARHGANWLVSDSLDWLVARPEIDRRLDEVWIGDFLATGHSLDPDRTVYEKVRRLPPGHCLELTHARESLRRHWRLAVEQPLFLRDGREYGERFRALTKAAIRDRTPPGRLGISMSGGLDSTSLASLSVEALGDAARVTARCTYFETLMPDEEPRYARLAAEMLDIELRLDNIDCAYDPQWRERAITTAEPTLAIVNAHREREITRRMAADASVWLYGEGPDNALVFERNAYLGWLLRSGRWRHAAVAAWRYLDIKFRECRHERADGALSSSSSAPRGPPPWLRPEFIGCTELAERVRAFNAAPAQEHPWHPRALASFGTPVWQTLLASLEADADRGVVWRHPYLDLRVLEFLLSVPPVPWARRKLVVREAMRGRLPAELLDRPKAALSADPLQASLQTTKLPPLQSTQILERWLDPSRLPDRPEPDHVAPLVAVHALDYWLG